MHHRFDHPIAGDIRDGTCYMIKELIPNVRVANESRELILNCCTEFIHLIASEANEICNQSKKKTINAEHVLKALDSLGFSDYKADAEAVLRDCKAVAAKRRRQSTRLENLGIPEEELLRQQQELFAKEWKEKANVEFDVWTPPKNSEEKRRILGERRGEQQAREEQQQWLEMQEATKLQLQSNADESDPDDYS
ncbi:hypothetical protein GE061_012167 [Apolygus lucorum]|uniref:Protein Dr1 n=1 Tax=Apolygus lucorum TaxID=248454 RepID=A0A8S9XSQ8_APOLU|nr:hypothetical protein GE061_012167 [Apolygus lucorum]